MCQHHMSLSPLRKLIKDYALICESYYAAIRDAPPSQIEAIDMGRRGLHNEAGEMLKKALEAHSPSTTRPRGGCLRSSARCTSGPDLHAGVRRLAGLSAVCLHL